MSAGSRREGFPGLSGLLGSRGKTRQDAAGTGRVRRVSPTDSGVLLWVGLPIGGTHETSWGIASLRRGRYR
jgi:hypothetical protein